MHILKKIFTGNAGEDLLQIELEQCGFTIVRTGQEHWLPKKLHSQLRKKNSVMSLAIRHTPDILAYHDKFPLAYWDAKVNLTQGTGYFTLWVSFYQAMLSRQLKGERVVVAFYDQDKRWYANWIEALAPSSAGMLRVIP